MPYKLSLIPEQNIAAKGWIPYTNNPYDENKINEITDNIGKTEVPVTSIPSPFAQMHLFETSFEFINKAYTEDPSILDGKTTYHKNISYCLDVYELLFGFETLKLRDRIRLEVWKYEELERLTNDHSPGIKTFSETLRIFIHNYNLDPRFKRQGIPNAFNEFTLIYYNHNIIAGTSPYTGFFTVGDTLPAIESSNANRKFFSNYLPLHKRDSGFQRFMNILFATEPKISQSFRELQRYININNAMPGNSEIQSFVSSLQGSSPNDLLSDFETLEANSIELSFLGGKVPFFCETYNREGQKGKARQSDYVIETSKDLENPPLALLEGLTRKRWNYIDGEIFPEDCEVDPKLQVESRQLPNTVIEYPWITRDDLLSKHLIQLDYLVNTSKYWLPPGDVKNILLPITTEYFNYFTIEDLKKQVTVEKLKMGAIVVTLEIPVQADHKRGSIRFERTYDHVQPETIDNDDFGAIIKSSLAFGIYPFFKVSAAEYNDRYKVLSYHLKGEEISYDFFRESFEAPNTTRVESKLHTRTRKDENYPCISNYFELTTIKYDSKGEVTLDSATDISFDGVLTTIKNQDKKTVANGVLLPIFGETVQLMGGTPSIAFDIGTSNSFVAVKTANTVDNISNYKGKAHSVSPHFMLLNEPSADAEVYKKYDLNPINSIYGIVQDAEFMPNMVGDDSLFKFPIRSIINIDNDTNSEIPNSMNILSNSNIPFAFGHNKMREEYDFIHSNIKWGVTDSNNLSARNKLKGFIEQLVWMGRNKLLSEGQNPKTTHVIWFKPLSMSQDQKKVFNEIWQELFNSYYNKEGNTEKLVSVTESWAPFYSYEKNFGGGEVYMNLDIGGGTTDLIIFSNERPALTTSFRFAGNSLFESRSSKPFDNGFITRYESAMRKEFGDDFTKTDTIDYIKNSKGLLSTDLLSYFFNYKSFKSKLMLDNDFMLLFLLHNCAIFYHAVQILKISAIEKLPSYLGVSGNGAKLLEITNGERDLNRSNGVAKLVQLIFKEIFELEKPHKIELQILKDPKESTAIGGILGIDIIKKYPNIDEENYYISVGDGTTLIDDNDGFAKKEKQYDHFLKEDDTTLSEITQNVIGFFEYFFDVLWFEADFSKNFGLEKSYNHQKLKEYFTDETKIYDTIRDAVNHKIEVEQESYMNDSLFFEPIKAYLFAFSKIIVSEKVNQFKGS